MVFKTLNIDMSNYNLYKSLGLIQVIINMNTIQLGKAFHLSILKNHDRPIITNADLYSILLKLYHDQAYDGIRIGKITKKRPDIQTYNSKIRALKASGIITPLTGAKSYLISGREKPSAEQVGCYLYPYSYLCYLSAMDYHGITDRIPKSVHLMTPPSQVSTSLLAKQYPDNWKNENTHEKIRNIKMSSKFERKDFIYHTNKNFNVYKEISNSGGLRVSPLGRTFLDMFKTPKYCGGFDHVLDILEGSGLRYLKLILNEFSKYGSNIDKSRLGFILENVLEIRDPLLDEWALSAQRGSSRVLVPGKEFSPYYSQKWCISINQESLQRYGTRN